MSQFIKKREIIILSILGVLLYSFFYYKVVITPLLPEIAEKQTNIAGLVLQKASLDHDFANLDRTKAGYKLKSFNNDRIGEYLMDTANVTDGLEYIEKISRMMGKEISSVNVNAPKAIPVAASTGTQSSTNGTAASNTPAASGDSGTQANTENTTAANTASQYYEFKVDFKTTLSYNEAMELVRYCEGGTRKVRISNFKLSTAADNSNTDKHPTTQPATQPAAQPPKAAVLPASGQPQKNPPGAAQSSVPAATTPAFPQAQAEGFLMADNSLKFDVTMSICFYSVNKGNLDKLYDYSQSKFQMFKDSSGIPIINEKKGGSGDIILPDIASNDGSTGGTAAAEAEDGGKITLASADLVIKEVGYLVGGENFEMFANCNFNDRIRIKTKDPMNISLSLNEGSYSIDANTGDGVVHNLNGSTDGGPFTIYVDSKVPYAKENEKIGLAIKIINSTDQAVNVALQQRTTKVRLYDRNGKEVDLKSDADKIYIV